MGENKGYLSSILGMVIFFLPIHVIGYLVSKEVDFQPRLTYFIFGSPVAILGLYLMRLGLRKNQKDAEEVLATDARAPVLFLRSFSNDENTIRERRSLEFSLLPSMRAEEYLTAFNRLGPLIAIGRPGEALPNLGAHKMYIENELWENKVIELFENSKAVIVMLGNLTGGVNWELNQARQLLSPSQLFIYFPYRQQREKRYTFYKEHLEKVFNCRFPPHLGNAYFIRFTDEWKPVWVADPNRDPLVAINNCISRIILIIDPLMRFKKQSIMQELNSMQKVLLFVFIINLIFLFSWLIIIMNRL